ncbi:MAG: DUF5723 family protein [Bacteroidota bacterium]|nr:DUF5723 family protein [Bacteroidota bacterium]
MMHGSNCRRKLFLLMLMTLMVTMVKAQSSLAFYPFENQFNSSNYNPAFLTSPQKFTFSIVPMGGTIIGYNNQALIKDLLTKVLSGGNPDDDYYMNALESMASKPMFNQNIESAMLNFTYRSKLGFFNFRIKDVQTFSASAKGDLTKFIIKEESQSVIIDEVQFLPTQVLHYREYSLGYSYKSPMNRFSAGIRAKLYFGKAAMYSSLSGAINQEGSDYVFNTDGAINTSFPEATKQSDSETPDFTKIDGSKILDYLLNTGNPGMGVDLGLKYRFTPDLSVSLSAIDIGKITWKNNLSLKYFEPYILPDTTYFAPEIGANKIVKMEGHKYSKELPTYLNEDSIPSSFSRQMPLSIYASIKYRVNSKLTISLTDRFMAVKNLNYNSISVAATIDVNRKLSINTGYSIIGDSYFNLPFAVLLKKDFGQMYFGTDNIASFLLPSISDYASFSFGTCFYLFKNRDSNYSSNSDKGPFYKSRIIKKNRKNGLIRRAYPDN